MKLSRREYLTMTTGALSLGFLPKFEFAQSQRSSGSLPRRSPESQGVSSKGILNFIQAANQSGLEWHSFMLVRHGNVVAEGWWKPFEADFKHNLYSIAKSFTSTAIGLLVDEGKLSVEDTVISFFKDELPVNPSDNLKAMRVKHLLTMTPGLATTVGMRQKPDQSWPRLFLQQPVVYTPGSRFLYDTDVSYMLGAILYKVTGQTLESYLRPRFFQPLGITEFDWEPAPDGLSPGGRGLRMKTEDIAKFGQFYLQKGQWQGKQLLSKAWVEEATRWQTETATSAKGESSYGYGYQFWRCKPEGVYRADGSFCQFCIVMPQQDAVLAVTSHINDSTLPIIWETILPAFSAMALPENTSNRFALEKAVKQLMMAIPNGSVASSLAAQYHAKEFSIENNPYGVQKATIFFAKDGCTLTFQTLDGPVNLLFGWEHWVLNPSRPKNLFPINGIANLPSKVAGTATWRTANLLELTLKYVELFNGDTFSFLFEGNRVVISLVTSVSALTTAFAEKRQKLVGTLKVD